jgi:L-arabinose isomerase
VVGIFVDFYKAIADVEAEKRHCLAAAVAFLGTEGEVVCHEWVATIAQASEANRRLRQLAPDAVVVIPLVAVFSGLASACLDALDCPIFIWSLQAHQRVAPDCDLTALIRNSGNLGATALANILVRDGRKFRVISGAGDPASGSPALVRLLAATRAATGLKSARIGIIGEAFAGMSDVALNCDWFHTNVGTTFSIISTGELAQAYASVQDSQVAEARRQLVDSFQVDSLRVEEETRSLRLMIAVDELVALHQLNAAAFNCHGDNCLRNPAIGVTGCYAVSLLTSAGCPLTCTGDVCTAIAMFVLRTMSGTSQYLELDMVDTVHDFVLLANGGEADLSLARGTPRVVGNQNFSGVHGRGASFDFVPRDGQATLLSYTPSFTNRKGRFVVAAGAVESIKLERMKLYHQRFRFAGSSAAHGFEGWCEAGAVHHAALSLGHWTEEVRWVASLLGFEFEMV